MAEEAIRIEVVYALPGEQTLVELEVAAGTTAGEAIHRSGIPARRPQADTSRIGVFGERVDASHVLKDGDRVEIYRPLVADPKEVRRETARRRRSVGKRA